MCIVELGKIPSDWMWKRRNETQILGILNSRHSLSLAPALHRPKTRNQPTALQDEVKSLELTLSTLVRPHMAHSSTSGGTSMEAEFAASAKGSLIIFTVNSFVASMFVRVSFGLRAECWMEIVSSGGSCDIYDRKRERRRV